MDRQRFDQTFLRSKGLAVISSVQRKKHRVVILLELDLVKNISGCGLYMSVPHQSLDQSSNADASWFFSHDGPTFI